MDVMVSVAKMIVLLCVPSLLWCSFPESLLMLSYISVLSVIAAHIFTFLYREHNVIKKTCKTCSQDLANKILTMCWYSRCSVKSVGFGLFSLTDPEQLHFRSVKQTA